MQPEQQGSAYAYPQCQPTCARTRPPLIRTVQASRLETHEPCGNTLHAQGFAGFFTTKKFSPDETTHAAVRAQGRKIIVKSVAIAETLLDERDCVVDNFSIADAALCYVEFRAD